MHCPVCRYYEAHVSDEGPNGANVECDCCGNFTTDISITKLEGWLGAWEEPAARRRRSRLSHLIRRQQSRDGSTYVPILRENLDRWRLDEALPTPAEQADDLVIWLGDHQHSPAEAIDIQVPATSAWLGMTLSARWQDSSFDWLLNELKPTGFIDADSDGTRYVGALTMSGWQRYEELKRARVTSRVAFMAMKFGEPELDSIVSNHFKPAVARTGFELRSMTDGQAAGLIDDQMRVRLRTSRFVVADLTHASRGAYWEAGFAEGLGRPVIYTCRAREWEAEEKPTSTRTTSPRSFGTRPHPRSPPND